MSNSSAQDQALPLSALMPPSGEGLRDYIAARLDPLDLRRPLPDYRSDLDLNPDIALTSEAEGYQPAAVLIGLVQRREGLNVLLTRRTDTLRRHAGQIAFPGGRGEAGEAAWQTALREACEEIGLTAEQVRLTGLSTPFRLRTGYDVTPVVGFVDGGFQPTPSPAEVAEVFEAPFAFLMDPANHERRLRDMPGGPRFHYAITWKDHVIWGATAAMLKALYDRLWGPPVGTAA